MQWIKASERLPELAGDYYCRFTNNGVYRGTRYFSRNDQEFKSDYYIDLEWLDETDQPSESKLHECKYCHAMTTQSDDECYAKPVEPVKSLKECKDEYAESLGYASWDHIIHSYILRNDIGRIIAVTENATKLFYTQQFKK